MTAFATPKYLCSECENDFDDMTLSKDPAKISEAIERVGKKMTAANNDGEFILASVGEIIENAKARGELIKMGEYDFSLDENTEEDGDVPEELLQTEEDMALEEKEKKAAKKFDTVINYITTGIFIAALGFIAYWIFTMLF